MEFLEAKKELLKLAKEAEACSNEYRRAYKSETPNELILVIKDNIHWCVNNKVVSAELLEKWFGLAILGENHVYVSGEHSLSIKETTCVVLLGSSQATVKTLGSSQATVKTLDSSQATVKTLDSSQATVETLGSSQATVKTLDSSQATVKTLDSSQATVETLGSSQATVKTLDSSQATVETLGSSQATVKTLDSSQATVKTLGSSQATVKTLGSSSKLTYEVSGGLVMDQSKRKIYIKKSDFEIEVIE